MRKCVIAAACCVNLLMMGASLAPASPVSFNVIVNTAPLVGNANGPFSLDFQLNDGSGLGDGNNTVTLSNFRFGGGSAAGAPTHIGGATGNLASGISLTDTDFLNEFFQPLAVGTTLSFLVTMTRNVDAGLTPDLFSFAILDNALFNIATTGLGDSLLLVNINNPALGVRDVQTYVSTNPAGVTVAAVPEPATLTLVALSLAGLGFSRRGQA
jgi:hypothetical protein